ncbi:hypothetical protein H2198_007376 [Neophaeococcomyces mojaviensis]|uniref:Uncharacterized protein n=1 Tax=Neophaeococcomyces mojaviensis TaxID=3383035 RepID=A0ACC3A0U5_9EURO|nr:hypothetical protein H2198_007376 [Knufia sp. JES_112]
MPPRFRLQSLADLSNFPSTFVCNRCQTQRAYASAATATTPAPTDSQILTTSPTVQRHSPINPPSHRDPKYRKSQLLRSYVSLLQTTPLIILFQHNNLKALEWASIRRELAIALQKVDDGLSAQRAETHTPLSDAIKLTVLRANIFEPALRITEYYKPSLTNALVPAEVQGLEDEKLDPTLTHALSRAAHTISQQYHGQHPLSPLLAGPIAALTFPTVSPQHLKAALSILAPQPPAFPAPTRRANPGYHQPAVQDGLKKLILLGARIDGEIFDQEGIRWVGSIEGGIDGLRAQLVAMLQGFGAGITTTLETASRSLWFTVEGRRRMLEEESKPDAAKEGETAAGTEEKST